MNPIIKFTLELGEGMEVSCIDKDYSSADGEIDVTGHLSSWDETEITRQRDGLTAVITEVLSPIVFDDKRVRYTDFSAYVLLKRLFEKYGLYSKAKLRIYRRDDIQFTGDCYTLLHELDLDFQHYQWEDGRITLDGTSPTLQQYLKSKGSTKFDIPVDDKTDDRLKEDIQFKYKPLKIESNASYEMPIQPDINLPYSNNRSYIFFQINHVNTETVLDKSIVLSKTQDVKLTTTTGFDYDNYFLEAVEDVTLSFELSFSIGVSVASNDGGAQFLEDNASAKVFLWVWDGSQNITIREQQLTKNVNSLNGAVNFTENYFIKKGERLYLVIESYLPVVSSIGGKNAVVSIGAPKFNVSWIQTSRTDTYIDVIAPQKLLQAVLDRIGGKGKFTGVIPELGSQHYVSMLCAAESIRGLENANIHVSLDDIIKWLEVKGYTYAIDGNSLVFDKMTNYFKKEISIEIEKASNVKIEALGDYCYTGVKIGYEKYEYDNINGRYEVNGTFEYNTGYVSDEGKILELISPFRADNYGIEFLTWKRWDTTEDNRSDNDVFEVAVKYNSESGFYEFEGTSFYTTKFGTAAAETGIIFYNAELCPKYLLMKNLYLLSIVSKLLSFSSTTNNRDAYIYAFESPFSNVNPGDWKLFNPYIYKITVDVSKLQLVSNNNGLVTFPCIDESGNFITKRGFIKDTSQAVLKEKAEEWTLYAVDDD